MRTGANRFWLGVRVTIGIVALGFSIYLVFSDEEALRSLNSISLLAFAPIILFQVFQLLIDAFRYREALASDITGVMGFWEWTRLFVEGRALNALVPQSGTAYRAAALRVQSGISLTKVLTSTVAVTWLGNGIVLVGLGTIIIAGSDAFALGGLSVLIGVVVTGFVLLAGEFSSWLGSLGQSSASRTIQGVARLASLLAGGLKELRLLSRTQRRVLVASAVAVLVGGLVHLVALKAVDPSEGLITAAALYAASTIVTFVSLSPNGIGIVELASAAMGAAVGFPAALAALVALAIRVSGVVALTGTWCLAGAIRLSGRGSAEAAQNPQGRSGSSIGRGE